jgi:fatty-acyl-CoA synthase
MSVTYGGSWIGYHARAAAQRTALADVPGGRRVSYAELEQRTARLAAALRSSFGVGRGDRVAMLSRNCALAFELMYACARLGAIFVPLNVRLAPAELRRLAADAGPSVLFGEQELLRAPIAPGIPALSWEQDLEHLLADGSAGLDPVPLGPDDPWVIIYTSGTTGLPKGVLVTHGGSAATMHGALAGGQVTSSSSCLTVLPVWHVAGLNLFANPVLFAGGTVLVMQAFDPATALDLLTRDTDPVTHFCGVPANYQFMQALPGFAAAPLRDFWAGVGGSPVPAALVRAWGERGVTLRTIYGISEAGAAVTMSPPGAAVTVPGDVGLPLWHLRCRVMDGDRACPPGLPGELQVAGTSVTPGYWRQPEATAQAVRDGWLRTGDIAVAGQDGRIQIIDRAKDMYISGGENVYPAEVEGVLYHHPAVAEVAVVGVPDQRWGESGAAWVVLAPGAAASADDIRSWARARIAAFKVPRDVVITDGLPRNATGKVLKAELRRQAAAGLG